MQVAIVWLRNNLRLHDNAPLHNALTQAQKVILVYVVDDYLFETSPYGFKKMGVHRANFLAESLLNLQKNIQAKGGNLLVVKGDPVQHIAHLAKQYNAPVFAEAEWAHYEYSLEQNLVNAGVDLRLTNQSTLFNVEDIPFKANTLPDIFTEFRKKTEKLSTVRPLIETPTNISVVDDLPYQTSTEIINQLVTPQPPNPKAAIHFTGGEDEALQRLTHYFWETDCLATYKETRNGLLGANYSSKFSAWLALGCISPRYIYWQVQQYERERTANQSTYWLVFELLWRDYFRFITLKYGKAIFLKGGILGNPRKLRNNPTVLQSWIDGQTGDDFVDANMIELKETGFMSNRGRQNVASYLVNNLGINWQAGAEYFEQQLIDYDVYSNWCNWNYVAGVGTDPREGRIFNTQKQAEMYDPNSQYRRHWLSA